MTQLRTTLVQAIEDVAALGRPWALVGGLAVSARVEPRPTRDVDLVLAVDSDQEAEAVIRALLVGRYEMVAALEHEVTGRLATARLRPVDTTSVGILVDLLFASCGIEAEIAARAEQLEVLPGVTCAVATVGDLIATKVLARDDRSRPQDYDDLMALIRAGTKDDLAVARAALSTISRRGYSRSRDLGRALDDAVAEASGLKP